jgi:VIT1/CCC1 family predicted Fe2+/Mn2+ transporter
MSEEVSLITSTEEHEKVDDRVFFALQERAGSMGNYQKGTVALWCLVGYLTGGLMLITPYLFFQDPYNCPDSMTSK